MDRRLSLFSDEEKCIGCGLCVRDCTAGNISLPEGKAVFGQDCYGCGHCIAVCPQGAVHAADPQAEEQVTDHDPAVFDVSPENLLNFIRFRRSVRQFRPEIPERELLERVIEAGRYTETASNLQRTEYIIVTENVRTLSQMCIDSLRDLGEKTLAAPENVSPLILGYARNWLKMAERTAETGDPEQFFFHAPSLILVTAVNPIDGGLASESMELMANALGLGAFFSGFFIRACRNDPKIRDFLGLPDGREVVTCLAVGWPAVKYYRTVPRKKPAVHWM